MVAHYLASSVSYPITIPNNNIDAKDDDNSRLFESPRKNNHSSSSFSDTMVITNTPNLSKLPTPGKSIFKKN